MGELRQRSGRLTWDRVTRSPEWLAVAVSVLALTISIVTFAFSEWDSRDRAIKDAAYQTCLNYTSNDGMRKLADDIYMGSIPNDKIQDDSERTYELARGKGVGALLYNHKLGAWMGFMDVVATGLEHGTLDIEVTRDCFAPSFERARSTMFGKKYFDRSDFPLLAKWSDRFHADSAESER
jgi:hypothetical protein